MRIPRSPLLRAGALLWLAAAGGCQSYRPLQLGDVRQGDRLRVTMADPVQLRLQEVTIERAVLIDAEAVGVRGPDVVLSALWVERQDGFGQPGGGWTVSIPASAVASVEQRRLSPWRSAVLTAGIVLATVLGWQSVGGGGGGEGNGGGGGQPR